jgi:hypothetical protein
VVAAPTCAEPPAALSLSCQAQTSPREIPVKTGASTWAARPGGRAIVRPCPRPWLPQKALGFPHPPCVGLGAGRVCVSLCAYLARAEIPRTSAKPSPQAQAHTYKFVVTGMRWMRMKSADT